jgi:hypothetical protein
MKTTIIKVVLAFFLIYLLPTFSFAQLVELEKPNDLIMIESDKFGNVYSVKQSGTYPNDTYQIRKWNGLNFTALTDNNISYFNGYVRKLEFDKYGNLFVVGDFKNSNGQFYVAKWNGNNWSQIGPSSARFGSVAINSIGEIVVSSVVSEFGINYNDKASILKWSGSNWSSLIDTANYNFLGPGDLEFDSYDNLYLSGAYDNLFDQGGRPIKAIYIAKWNNNGLVKLGSNGTLYPDLYSPYKWVNSGVPDIEIGPDNNLYVIGLYTYTNSNAFKSVLKWTGYWNNLGSAVWYNDMSKIRFDLKGNLLGSSYLGLFKYNGSNWTSLDSLKYLYSAEVKDIGFDVNNNIFLSTSKFTSNTTSPDYFVFKYFTNPPILTNFTPKLAFKSDAVTINGKNLFGVTSVIFGIDTAQSFQVLNDSTLIAYVGKGSSGNIKVINPAGTSILSGFVFPAPIVQSFDPMKSASEKIITIKGLNFRDVQNVTFGGISAKLFNVINNTTISATVSKGNSGYVSVTTLGGKDSLVGFIYIPEPSITSYSPSTATTGQTVIIIGTNFTDATNVSFGGIAAKSYTVLTSNTITAIIDNGNSGNVSVITPGGSASLAGFTFIPAPAITSFTPTYVSAGGTVTIKGKNFNGTNSVSFGGVVASSYIVINDTTINAIVGNGSTGNVSVTTLGGSSSLAGFIFNPYKLGLSELQNNPLQLYPNPAQETITIKSELNLNGKEYCIFDFVGKLVLRGKFSDDIKSVSVSELNNGIYILTISDSNNKLISTNKMSIIK